MAMIHAATALHVRSRQLAGDYECNLLSV